MSTPRRRSQRRSSPADFAEHTPAKKRKTTNNGEGGNRNGSSLIHDSEGFEKHRRESKNLAPLDKLGKLSAQHQLLTSELFHLERFTSLATWDPEAPASKFYHDFVEDNHDLWSQPTNSTNGESSKSPKRNGIPRKSRHSSRIVTDPIKPLVEDAQTKYIDEVFNPTKFYHENFLIKKEKGRRNSKPLIMHPVSTPAKTVKLASLSEKMKSEVSQSVNSSTTTTPKKPKGRPARVKAEKGISDSVQGDELKVPSLAKSRRGRKPKTFCASQDVSSDPSEFESDTENQEELVDSDDDSFLDFPSPELYKYEGPLPKVKLKLSPPKPVITNPGHVAESEFPSLEDYLNSYKSLDEDVTNEDYDKYVSEQKTFVDVLRRAVHNNVLTVDEEFNITKVPPPRPFRDPLKNQHTHHDHLVAQAAHLSRIFADSKRARISRARKVANMIEVHFKRLAGAEERARKEEERRLKTLARNAVQVVKKRWMLAEKAFRILKRQENEELKRIKGKEHLSQMLEHSTQLLEAQMGKENDSDDEGGPDLLANESQDDIKGDDLIDIDDSELTVEELKAKYAHLQGLKLEEVSEATEEPEELTEHTEATHEVSDEEIQNTAIAIPELTKQEKNAIEAANNAKHNSLLDSDTSLDSDDDSVDMSSEDSDSDSDEADEGSNGLASLFRAPTNDEEFDDEYSAQDEKEEEESEEGNKENSTPSSTPEIDRPSSATISKKASRGTSSEPLDNNGVVDVPVPDLLLRGNLRHYQKQGLNWLASLYNNHTNGILADEMGLGKTIQTISLISYLAVFKGVWGPHLIVVPTSVLLNWEMEFKRFAPGFKLMVYYGSPQQRKEKRKGWNKPDTFHVCITSYQLVCQDQQIFKRKRWRYMILDEAHNIKNFKSNRWNALLNFNTENRLLLTGTPLQNNIMELWSLLYFLMPSSKTNHAMPSGFANLDDFQQWFGKPVDKIIEGGVNQEVDQETKRTVAKLHQVLRPYLLRRLKADVEAQMPGKYEHVVTCRLSKRQYKLYHEYLARGDTKEMLKNANYISIINCLMQLRKVCNHPDLFEERPILTSFAVPTSVITPYATINEVVLSLLNINKKDKVVDFNVLNLNFAQFEREGLSSFNTTRTAQLKSSKPLLEEVEKLSEDVSDDLVPNYSNIQEFYKYSAYHQKKELLGKLQQTVYLNDLRCDKAPVYGQNLLNTFKINNSFILEDITFGQDLVKPLETRIFSLNDEIERYSFVTPAVVTLNQKKLSVPKELAIELTSNDCQIANPFHKLQTKLSIQFPDKSLLLYDCGKLQKLAKLLQELKDGGHRALIFTQMTKVLDILEQFLNIMGIRYMRLDGATKIEDRQILTERFNSDPKIMVFILSTRSGGLGINLTGADTVIFYDSDWNPAMDKQCQDRCHRIGQTRDVHIYRFVSEYTIESNILKKANQKRHLDDIVIQEGEFNTDYFSKLSVRDLLGDGNGTGIDDLDDSKPLFGDNAKIGNVLAQAEDESDAKAAKEAMKEVELDNEDFDDENKTVEETKNKGDGEFGQDEEGIGHIDEYMIRFIANGYYFD